MTDCAFCRIAGGDEKPEGKLWHLDGEAAVFTNASGDVVAVPVAHEPPTLASLAWQAQTLFAALFKALANRGMADRPLEVTAHLNGYHTSVPHLHVIARMK